MQTDVKPVRLLDKLRELRHFGKYVEARAILADLLVERPADSTIRLLSREHAEFWWEPLIGPRARLTRRGPADADFVCDSWSDTDFMKKFNRMAAPLPSDRAALQALLTREQTAIVSESQALHWTIETAGRKVGFISVVNIAVGHRRAEFLIGIRGECSSWVGPEVSHLVLSFIAKQVGIERLTAYFYPENKSAIEAACKLGFVVEGTLRSYVRSTDGTRGDLVVAGLILNQDYFNQKARIRQRLLATRPSPHLSPLSQIP